jgi:hypothetical protein
MILSGGTEIIWDTSTAGLFLGCKKKEQTKYTLMSHHMHAGKNHNLKIVDRCFQNVWPSHIWE